MCAWTEFSVLRFRGLHGRPEIARPRLDNNYQN